MCALTKGVWGSVLYGGRGAFLAGEGTLSGFEVILQLVLHLQVGLRC